MLVVLENEIVDLENQVSYVHDNSQQTVTTYDYKTAEQGWVWYGDAANKIWAALLSLAAVKRSELERQLLNQA